MSRELHPPATGASKWAKSKHAMWLSHLVCSVNTSICSFAWARVSARKMDWFAAHSYMSNARHNFLTRWNKPQPAEPDSVHLGLSRCAICSGVFLTLYHTCLPFGIFPEASSFARACRLFSILLYCLAFTYSGSSSTNSFFIWGWVACAALAWLGTTYDRNFEKCTSEYGRN